MTGECAARVMFTTFSQVGRLGGKSSIFVLSLAYQLGLIEDY